jgi:hypothetical protein
MSTGAFIANPGAGGAKFSADLVADETVPLSKIDIGASGVSSPVNAANPLPVGLPAAQLSQLAPLATQPVSGTVGVNNFPATQAVSGTVAVSNFPASQPVTGPLTDAQLRAAALAVNTPALTAVGNITAINATPGGAASVGSAVELALGSSSTLTVQVVGSYTGALSLQVTIDGTNWITVGGTPFISFATNGYLANITSALTGMFQADVTSVVRCRITALAAVTGSATVNMYATAGASALVSLDAPIAIQAAQTLANVTTVGTVTIIGNGQTAHSSPSTGNPLRAAGRVSSVSDITLISGDACDLFMTTSGALVEKPFSAPELDWQFAGAAGGITNTADVVIAAAGGAGIRNYVTALSITNASATGTEVVIKDGAAVIWRGFVGAQTLPNSSIPLVFPTPLRGTAATALNVACITAGAAVYVNAQGYRAV